MEKEIGHIILCYFSSSNPTYIHIDLCYSINISLCPMGSMLGPVRIQWQMNFHENAPACDGEEKERLH